MTKTKWSGRDISIYSVRSAPDTLPIGSIINDSSNSPQTTPSTSPSCAHDYDKSTGYCTNTKCKLDHTTQAKLDESAKGIYSYNVKSGGIPILPRPYRTETTKFFMFKGDTVNVIGSIKNAAGELWYKLENNGGWVYSDNVQNQSFKS